MQNTKAAGTRHQPLLTYSLRSPHSDRNGNEEERGERVRGGVKDNSSLCGLNLRSLITTLSQSSCVFAQPDMSRQIRRTHLPVIGFRGKVFRLTLEKGWLPSLVN